jgi:hypothetical protein
MDFEPVVAPRSDAAEISAYALAYVYTPQVRRATLAIGGLNPMRAWLNARPIYEYDPAQPSPRVRDLVPVTLQAGRNTLLVKVGSGDGPMKAYLSFVEPTANDGSGQLPGNRWAPVLDDFEGAAALAPRSLDDRLGIACAQLASGDRASASRILRELFSRYGDTSGYMLIYTSWLCGMAPDLEVDRESLLQALRRAQESDPAWSSIVARDQLADPIGVALLRGGQDEEAIKRLETMDKARAKGNNVATLLYLAMAHQGLGHADLARRSLEAARAWLAEFRRDPIHPSWPLARRPCAGDRLEWRLLLREAELQIEKALPSGRPSERP